MGTAIGIHPVKKALVGLPALLLALVCAGCSSEAFVDEVVIDNPTDFAANVGVTGGERDGWLDLGTAESHSERTVEQVIDQGSTWIFRFSYSGYEEEVELSRDGLERSGWRVQVPESFATALRDRGVLPPP
jgi:hypothetical protein